MSSRTRCTSLLRPMNPGSPQRCASRALSVVNSAGPGNFDSGYERLDADQRKLVDEALGVDGRKAIAQNRQWKAQIAADHAKDAVAAAEYERLGALGKVWWNAAGFGQGLARELVSGVLTTVPRLQGMFFENGPSTIMSWAEPMASSDSETISAQ